MEVINHLFAQINENDINVPKASLNNSTIANVLHVVFGFAGAIAFLMIVIGALQYVLSEGKPEATAKAKDTILYALVGLVVCILAFAIVGFVFNRI